MISSWKAIVEFCQLKIDEPLSIIFAALSQNIFYGSNFKHNQYPVLDWTDKRQSTVGNYDSNPIYFPHALKCNKSFEIYCLKILRQRFAEILGKNGNQAPTQSLKLEWMQKVEIV